MPTRRKRRRPPIDLAATRVLTAIEALREAHTLCVVVLLDADPTTFDPATHEYAEKRRDVADAWDDLQMAVYKRDKAA